ncbi:DUF308 domain-containing protein [Candidatus Saccharibacteria bacterium]|nr:DUF308 domain-containing protein [Candidatus Saccharibacteria bacterium]
MAHINRRFIDKHWLTFVFRGGLGAVFGFLLLFGGMNNYESVIAMTSVFLLGMGIIDALSALYSSTKKKGWLNSVVDALVDVAAALALLFAARSDLVLSLAVVALYVFVSGVIDIFHGFLSTVDPTDRFIRVLAGVIGCVMGLVILNSGTFEIMTFLRFFGAYMLIVGVTSMIYGVHNHSQRVEDSVARSEARKKPRTSAKASTKTNTKTSVKAGGRNTKRANTKKK